MENPNKQIWRSVMLVLFGLALGAIPGLIKLDQMRRQTQTEIDATYKEIAIVRHSAVLAAERADDEKAKCDALTADDSRTILVDLNHPYGDTQQYLFGASLTMPFRPATVVASSIATGPIWVIPHAVTPHVIDGVLGAAYTHIWPDGRNDGWKGATRAEVNP
jgi:hypothetical protein